MDVMSNVIDDEAGARTSDTGELTMYTTSWLSLIHISEPTRPY